MKLENVYPGIIAIFYLSILGSEQDNNPKFFHGCVMAAFIGVEHGLNVVSLFVSKMMAKKDILVARWAF